MYINCLFDESYFHFSIDDVFTSLIEATQGYENLFDHPFFKFLNELHRHHGINIDLYLFFEQEKNSIIYNLEDVSDRFKSELQNAKWLKLAPHALNMAIAPYQQSPERQIEVFDKIYAQIHRFAGANKCCSTLRLHYFSESYQLYEYWKTKNVSTLLFTDKPAVSYQLPKPQRIQLAKSGSVSYKNLNIRRSQFRMENLTHLKQTAIKSYITMKYQAHGYLTLFSHEADLISPQVRDLCHRFINDSKATLYDRG